ncbi:MAG TPA: hypothetical protein VK698_10435 [Kofleriaceae bacterium]|nr:hypothetical protein [Kofleriaceae bacterium]
MSTTRRAWAAPLFLILASGCGDDDGGSASDAGSSDAGSCLWPMESSTPGGELEIGTGVRGFEPMPDELQFIAGTQSGTFLILHARMKGLEPGNADDFLDPRNPRTRFSATLFDGTVVGRGCPSTQGYKPSEEEGYFERKSYQNLEFLPFALGEKAFDTTVKLRVEIIDADGRYAVDEKDVLCPAPTGWNDAGPTDAGIIDGGPADAGPADAGADAAL